MNLRIVGLSFALATACFATLGLARIAAECTVGPATPFSYMGGLLCIVALVIAPRLWLLRLGAICLFGACAGLLAWQEHSYLALISAIAAALVVALRKTDLRPGL